MKAGPILDRGLTVEVLDAALHIARSRIPFNQSLRRLEVALRESLSEQEATTKTRKILTRIWVRPPPYAKAMVDWVISLEGAVFDPRILHLGAILASYPFFGEVCAFVGRQLNLTGEVNTSAVRQNMHGTWGERSSVDVGARRCIRTLRFLGILSGDSGSSRSVAAEPLTVPGDLRTWFIHALMLTRQSGSIDERDVERAPELFMVRMDNQGDKYPYLERVNEAGGRRVLVIQSGNPIEKLLF